MPSQPLTGSPHVHTIGIGAGPANLSLAALFEAVAPAQIVLFEQQTGPGWHDGLLHDGVRMQTSWMKDLVSTVDPTHRLSFLNYLVSTGRLYAYLNAQYDSLPRQEYVRYLGWASERLAAVRYGQRVDEVAFCDDRFVLRAAGQTLATCEHVVFGIGTVASVPTFFRETDQDLVVVADRLAARVGAFLDERDQPVAVVGGGQTGAEAVLSLLGRGFTDVLWIGRRPWFAPLDESPPANEFYRPAYQKHLHTVPRVHYRKMAQAQVLTSDGVSAHTLRSIYQLNYDRLLADEHAPLRLMPGRTVVGAEAAAGELRLTCAAEDRRQVVPVRWAVVATGRTSAALPVAEDLLSEIELTEDGDVIVEPDYSVRWKRSGQHRMFALNRARDSHGPADANLSLLPTRSAMVINSLFDRTVYELRDNHVQTEWL